MTEEHLEISNGLGFDIRQGLGTEPDMGPDAGDLVFHGSSGQIWQVAAGAAGMPPKAEEIVVLAAFTPGPAVADLAATPSTPQVATGFQIVGVPPGAVARDTTARQNLLHGLPGDLVDQGFMLSVEQHSLETDQTLVVGLGQHAMHLSATEWLATVFQGVASLETALLKRVAERGNAPLPGGVLSEGPLDMRGTRLIDNDALDLGAVDPAGGI
nr:hypothetical protein [Mycobacterium riyadhense]